MPDVSLDFNLTNGTTADAVQVMANLNEIVAAVNDLDEANLSSALATLLGVSQSGSPRRGKCIVPAAEFTGSAAYTLLPTPDRVSGIVLPTDGLLLIGYKALWKSQAGSGTCKAAVFLGANQLKLGAAAAAPSVQEATLPGNGIAYTHLTTSPTGLVTGAPAATDASDVTTGQILGAQQTMGGLMAVFAAAGTYDVSVQFIGNGAVGDLVTVKNRKLWVQAVGF